MTFSKGGGIHEGFFFPLSLKAIPAMREQERKKTPPKKKKTYCSFWTNCSMHSSDDNVQSSSELCSSSASIYHTGLFICAVGL